MSFCEPIFFKEEEEKDSDSTLKSLNALNKPSVTKPEQVTPDHAFLSTSEKATEDINQKKNITAYDQTTKYAPHLAISCENTLIKSGVTDESADLTHIKKRLFLSNSSHHKEETQAESKDVIDSKSACGLTLNTPQPKDMHNKTTAKQTSHSAKRKRSDFENFQEKIYLKRSKCKIANLFMGDIKLADSLKHKDLTFRLFKDRELGISKGFQKILHNSSLDDDCPTDSQQMKLAYSHTKRELFEAIRDQNKKSCDQKSEFSLRSFDESFLSSGEYQESESSECNTACQESVVRRLKWEDIPTPSLKQCFQQYSESGFIDFCDRFENQDHKN